MSVDGCGGRLRRDGGLPRVCVLEAASKLKLKHVQRHLTAVSHNPFLILSILHEGEEEGRRQAAVSGRWRKGAWQEIPVRRRGLSIKKLGL